MYSEQSSWNIVPYVAGKWEKLHIMSRDSTGNNYDNAKAYTADAFPIVGRFHLG